MPLPGEDLAIVTEWVDALNSAMPAHVVSQLRYRVESYRNAVTLLECRPLTVGDAAGEWLEMPFARLRFFRSLGWQLFWVDRNSDFHIYDLVEPTQDITKLLDEIDRDPTCIFFG